MNKKQAKGQVVLMVLLTSALVLVLGLSAAKQATIETNIDTDQELLKRAFNAAESGIEYYIKTGNKTYESADNQGKSSLDTKPLGNDLTLSFNKKIGQEDSETFWLVDHLENGNIGSDYYSRHDNTIDVCSASQTGVVNFKIDYFYKQGSQYRVQRVFGDNAWVSTDGGTLPNNCAGITLQGDSILMVVTPMGTDTVISIKGNYNFPLQGEKIISTGSVGRVNNQVTIDHPFKLAIPFLFETVMSEGSVTNSNIN